MNFGFSVRPFHTVGCIVVKPGIIIDPVMVDGNKPTKNSAIYHLKNGQTAPYVVLSILEKRLRHLERLPWNNGFMLSHVLVLIQVLPVFPALMLKQIRCEGFPGQDVAAVPLICEDIADGAAVPLGVSGFCPAADIRQEIRDMRLGPSMEICVENEADHLSLPFVDDKRSVFDIAAGGVLLPVIAQQRRGQQLAVLKPLGQRPDHSLPLFNGFLLGNRGEKCEHQFRILPQSVQMICLKKHAHRRREIFELPNQGDTVHQVPRKTGDAFCHDQVVFAVLAGGNHGVEFRAVFQGRARDALVRVHAP